MYLDMVGEPLEAVMPDGDRLPRSLSRGWRRVLKAFRAGESQEDIAYDVVRAIAETLRRTHGIPALPALGARLHEVASAGSAISAGGDGSFDILPGHIPTSLARRAVDALSAGLRVHCGPGPCGQTFQSASPSGGRGRLGDLVPPDGPHRRGDDQDFNVNAMLWQVTRLRPCLAGPEPWQRLVCEFLELLDVTGLANEEVVRLYRAYVEEWDTYEHAAWAGCLAGHESGVAAL